MNRSLQARRWTGFKGYLAAILVVASALLVRMLLDRHLGPGRPYLTLFGGVAIAIWVSSWRPAALAALLGFLAAHGLFADERIEVDPHFAVEFLGYALSTGLIIAIGELMHRAKERADAQSEKLRVTLASIGDAVITTDAKGAITALNPVAEALTGWSDAEAQGRDLASVFRIVNEDTGRTAQSPVEKVLREGTTVGLANHTALISRDGRHIPIDDSAAPIREDGGPLHGVVMVFRDVSQVRDAHRAKARLAAIVESSGDAIFTKSVDGIVRTWNAGAERLFGYQPFEIVGKPVTLIIPPDRLAEEAGILARIRAGKSSERIESVRVAKDGRHLPVLISVSPIRDEYGVVTGASSIVHDITERRRAEAALEEADRRKDEFLAVLSHELRNPLAPIRMAASVLERTVPSDPRVQGVREIIERQTSQLARLLDDLLDVSRITSGKIALRKDQASLALAISSAVESVRPHIDAKGHELVLRTPTEPLYVHGDVARLAQVVANLLSNASKYTEDGGRIELSLARERRSAVIRVRDSGIGLTDAQISRIFVMFAQIDPSLERGQGGLGVGLALTKRLVELHGGRIEVTSAGLGKGSEFVVKIPLLNGVATAPAKHRAEQPRAGAVARRRILVADDNVDSAETLAAVLRHAGHDVRVVHDGVAALEECRGFDPELAFIDIGMPRMNGYDVAKELRTRHGRDLLLVALTGWGKEEDKRRASEAGFDHHLTKPVQYEDVEDLLRLQGGGLRGSR